MPKFAANLSMLFTEAPFLERFALAKQAGFSYVEYLFPYDYPVAALKQLLQENGLQQVLFNLPSGNWAGGERGLAALPERQTEFRDGVEKAIEYALALDVPQLNCLAGKVTGATGEEHWRTLIANVRYTAEALQKHNLRLVIEPINPFDVPGFYLTRTVDAVRLIEEAGMPNVFVQYDVYHAQRVEGDLTATIRRYKDKIGHIQVADNPGRHQPGTGEINYPFVFTEIDATGYQGFIGLEYVPLGDSKESVAWIKEYGY